MALIERERPYETLIRHNGNGTIGAHHIRITEVLRDGVVISASVGAAVSLAVADGQSGLKLSDVLGEAATLALKQLEAVTTQNQTLTWQAEQTRQQLESANALIEQLRQQIADQAAALEQQRLVVEAQTESLKVLMAPAAAE